MTLFETNCQKREKGKKRSLTTDEYLGRLNELIWVLFREPLMALLGGDAMLGLQGQG